MTLNVLSVYESTVISSMPVVWFYPTVTWVFKLLFCLRVCMKSKRLSECLWVNFECHVPKFEYLFIIENWSEDDFICTWLLLICVFLIICMIISSNKEPFSIKKVTSCLDESLPYFIFTGHWSLPSQFIRWSVNTGSTEFMTFTLFLCW